MSTTHESRSSIDKLHAMLKEIGVESNVANLKEEEFKLPPSNLEKKTNGISNDREVSILNEEDDDSKRLLLNLEYDFEEEDSWLFKSPSVKHETPARYDSPEKWITVSTPEINRAKGSLTNKLDLIALENKKDKFESIKNKHNFHSATRQDDEVSYTNSHDVETLDWEYDEDQKARSKVCRSKTRTIRKHYSYSRNSAPLPVYEGDESVSSYDDAPFKLDFPEDECDDLQPMTLAFEAPSTTQHSTPTIPKVSSKLRRTSSGGNSQRRVDKYDLAVDELVATPTGNVRPRPSKYQFDLSSNATSDSPKPITMSYSDHSDADSIDSSLSDSLPVQPRGGSSRSMDDGLSGLARPRARGKEIPSPRGGSNPNLSTGLQVKPRGLVRPRTSPAASDSGVRVRQSPAAEVSGIVRPRGSGQTPVAAVAPVPRGMNRSTESKIASPGNSDLPQPRTGLPQVRKSTGMVQPKGSLGVVRPRRSRSPDPTTRAAIPRGSAAVSRNAYADM